jgi:hypothetical protein
MSAGHLGISYAPVVGIAYMVLISTFLVFNQKLDHTTIKVNVAHVPHTETLNKIREMSGDNHTQWATAHIDLARDIPFLVAGTASNVMPVAFPSFLPTWFSKITIFMVFDVVRRFLFAFSSMSDMCTINNEKLAKFHKNWTYFAYTCETLFLLVSTFTAFTVMLMVDSVRVDNIMNAPPNFMANALPFSWPSIKLNVALLTGFSFVEATELTPRYCELTFKFLKEHTSVRMLSYAKILLITSYAYLVVIMMIAVSIVITHFTTPAGHSDSAPGTGASGAISGSGRARSSSRGRAPARGGAAPSSAPGEVTVMANRVARRICEMASDMASVVRPR